MADRCPAGAYDGPDWRAEWWARVPVSNRGGERRHTRDGERRDDFDIRREMVDRGRPARRPGRPSQTRRGPKAEVVGLSNEKATEILGNTIAQFKAGLASVSRKLFPLSRALDGNILAW